jgi:hypothetical protein
MSENATTQSRYIKSYEIRRAYQGGFVPRKVIILIFKPSFSKKPFSIAAL